VEGLDDVFVVLGCLGGGKDVVLVGERCLLGVNFGIGISLGDDCVVEVGFYVIVGIKVIIVDGEHVGIVVKVCELLGMLNMLLCCNFIMGWVEMVVCFGMMVEFNVVLYVN